MDAMLKNEAFEVLTIEKAVTELYSTIPKSVDRDRRTYCEDSHPVSCRLD